MRRLSLLLIFVFLCFAVFPRPTLGQANNIFGLHLTQPSDLDLAAPIINSKGGDWGWVTIVIRLDQLDHGMWQDFFNKCRRLHIIPIVRLATINESGTWKRPSLSDLDNLASFLNSLNWPSVRQHVILFNEINHAQEWGGSVDIKNYADMAIYAADKLKNYNQNFIILSSGLDLAAPQKMPEFSSASNIYNELLQYRPDFFDHIDALASHSYPNHGYIGTPDDTGRHSITGYLWELQTLKNLGITKKLPVFITETGWPHREGDSINNSYYSVDTSANFLISALLRWQNDPLVLAVTPFIFNYPYPPFDHFSWLDESNQLYPSYQRISEFPKRSQKPEQITKNEYVKIHLPLFMFPGNEYAGTIFLKNNGQSIWGKNETEFCLTPDSTQNIILDPICTADLQISPGETMDFPFKFKLNESQDKSFISWLNLPVFQINSILPIITDANIYRPENSLFDRVKRSLLYLLN